MWAEQMVWCGELQASKNRVVVVEVETHYPPPPPHHRQEAKEVETEYQRVESEGPASHRKKDLLDKVRGVWRGIGRVEGVEGQ